MHGYNNSPSTKPMKTIGNKIIRFKDCAEVCLCNRKRELVAKAKIDLDDIEKIERHTWHLNNTGYATTNIFKNGKKKYTLLHRYILDNIVNLEVDHINRIPLDNRKKNLRICTSRQNSRNTNAIGVTWHKDREKWVAQIMVNYKQINLGYYIDKEDALKARKKAEIKYFKEFRNKSKGIKCS